MSVWKMRGPEQSAFLHLPPGFRSIKVDGEGAVTALCTSEKRGMTSQVTYSVRESEDGTSWHLFVTELPLMAFASKDAAEATAKNVATHLASRGTPAVVKIYDQEIGVPRRYVF